MGVLGSDRRDGVRRRPLQLCVSQTIFCSGPLPGDHPLTVERVLTVRRTLENDLKVARQPKQRSRRGNVEYGDNTKFRSPLVMVEWWRTVMDEVRLYRSPQPVVIR